MVNTVEGGYKFLAIYGTYELIEIIIEVDKVPKTMYMAARWDGGRLCGIGIVEDEEWSLADSWVGYYLSSWPV